MSLAKILTPPPLDEKQALRLRRLGLAAIVYASSLVLLVLAWTFGVLTATAALEVAAAYVVINLGLYLAIRSGFNYRFRDPSLTLFQMLAAIVILMFIVYNMDAGRDVALFGSFIVLLFGVFRLNLGEFRLVTLFTLAAYALVINLLMHLRPQVVPDVPLEWMSWLMLAGFLPCFTVVGGQINSLRRKLRASVEELRIFADNVPALTVSWDENLCCRFANKAFVEFFGLAGKDIIGKHVREVLGTDAYREIEGHFAQALSGRSVTYERTRKLPDAEPRYIEVKLLPHIGGGGKVLGCFAVTTDITEHKLAEERIQQVAHHDNLTGLANRLLFNDRLNQAINLAKRHSRQVALLYLDLDNFKPVHDTLGHGAGDELLKGVAERLQRQVRESDTVARIGGDEFTVILPDIALRDEAQTVARKIIAALGAPFQLGSTRQSVQIGTSIGIAVYPADARDVDALIKAADAAMYCAKHAEEGLRKSRIA